MEKKRPDNEERELRGDYQKYADGFEKQIKLAKDFIERQAGEDGDLSAMEELTKPSQERLDRVFSESEGMAVCLIAVIDLLYVSCSKERSCLFLHYY